MNPSDSIVGITPDYGIDGVNNNLCDATDPTVLDCDLHAQSDTSTAFKANLHIPEPGSIALLGPGLVGLGGLSAAGAARTSKKSQSGPEPCNAHDVEMWPSQEGRFFLASWTTILATAGKILVRSTNLSGYAIHSSSGTSPGDDGCEEAAGNRNQSPPSWRWSKDAYTQQIVHLQDQVLGLADAGGGIQDVEIRGPG